MSCNEGPIVCSCIYREGGTVVEHSKSYLVSYYLLSSENQAKGKGLTKDRLSSRIYIFVVKYTNTHPNVSWTVRARVHADPNH